MYSKVYSGTAIGISGTEISVEADISSGLPGLTLVGFLSSSVKEAGERVKTALKNSGIIMPPRKITINLSPASLRKDGTVYDLAIATAILSSLEIIPDSDNFKNTIFLGELCLDGSVRQVNGVLPIVDFAVKNQYKRVIVPVNNVSEATLVNEIDVIGIDSIKTLIDYLNGDVFIKPSDRGALTSKIELGSIPDFKDIKGQKVLKRGMEIAASGFHNIIMTGAAGSGKSLIAKSLPGILPELTYEECIEITKIYSVAGKLPDTGGLISKRPFRAPHSTTSEIALVGGGSIPKPGEISLANNGVLFLDEFPEFRKNAIECLRQPIEDGIVTVSRVNAAYTFPSKFILVAAMNPCPCGFFPDRNRCTCTDRQINNYQNKISYPILDRIDLGVDIRPVEYSELFGESNEETTEVIKKRVDSVRRLQVERFKSEDFQFNSQIPQSKVDKYIKIKSGKELLKRSFDNKELSARSYFRVLRLSRTIADMNGNEEVTEADIQEALFFKNKLIKGDMQNAE